MAKKTTKKDGETERSETKERWNEETGEKWQRETSLKPEEYTLVINNPMESMSVVKV